jgi:hypothetical protein
MHEVSELSCVPFFRWRVAFVYVFSVYILNTTRLGVTSDTFSIQKCPNFIPTFVNNVNKTIKCIFFYTQYQPLNVNEIERYISEIKADSKLCASSFSMVVLPVSFSVWSRSSSRRWPVLWHPRLTVSLLWISSSGGFKGHCSLWKWAKCEWVA